MKKHINGIDMQVARFNEKRNVNLKEQMMAVQMYLCKYRAKLKRWSIGKQSSFLAERGTKLLWNVRLVIVFQLVFIRKS